MIISLFVFWCFIKLLTENMAITRLFDILTYQKEKNPLQKSMLSKQNGAWRSWSTEDLIRLSDQLAAGLLEAGIQKGDKVAMSAYTNRVEWIIVDIATQKIGAINVPLYPTISPREYEYILNDAEVKLCFTGANDLPDKVKTAQPNVASLKHIVSFDKRDDFDYWEKYLSTNADSLAKVKELSDTVRAEDLATIIYTSGTTGNPKGVMLCHDNIMAVVRGTVDALPAEAGESVLSFLPLCHIFERAVYFCYMHKGVVIYYTGTDNLGGPDGDLQDVKPVFFTTVPRLLEKVYEKIFNKGLELTGLKKKLFFWALDLTDDYQHNMEYSGLRALKMKIADKLIYSKWREALGGNMKSIVTGAAACPDKIAKVFSCAGIPVLEGYGLTETSPTLTINRKEKGGGYLGSVGSAIDGVELYIDPSDGDYREGEGEILAHGPNIMMGYYNKPEATAEVFKNLDNKTWFRTGDVGKFISGPGGKQFLKITDRKKELLKTSGGKYVAPSPIENKFKEDFLIEQMMVVGENMKFVSALIVPAEEALKDYCSNNNIPWTNITDAVKNPKVIARFQECVDKYNPNFSHIEQIKKFTLLTSTWDAVKTDGSDAELTPTMKLKRRVIMSKYNNEIDKMYS